MFENQTHCGYDHHSARKNRRFQILYAVALQYKQHVGRRIPVVTDLIQRVCGMLGNVVSTVLCRIFQ